MMTHSRKCSLYNIIQLKHNIIDHDTTAAVFDLLCTVPTTHPHMIIDYDKIVGILVEFKILCIFVVICKKKKYSKNILNTWSVFGILI